MSRWVLRASALALAAVLSLGAQSSLAAQQVAPLGSGGPAAAPGPRVYGRWRADGRLERHSQSDDSVYAANTRIDEFEAKAKPKRAQAEVAAIDGLKAARQNIERMLVDLKTAGDAQAVRAKADIDKAIVTFQASLEDFRRKFTTPSEKK